MGEKPVQRTMKRSMARPRGVGLSGIFQGLPPDEKAMRAWRLSLGVGAASVVVASVVVASPSGVVVMGGPYPARGCRGPPG